MEEESISRQFWKSRGRIFWKDDLDYLKYHSKIMTEKWTFLETWDYIRISNSFPSDSLETIKNITNDKWISLIREWLNNKTSTKVAAFAAITFLFAILPYNKMIMPEKEFTNFQISNFNKIARKNGLDSLPFKNLEPFIEEDDEGPLLPAAYLEWVNNEYDKAAW
jgi:hypothetical protein